MVDEDLRRIPRLDGCTRGGLKRARRLLGRIVGRDPVLGPLLVAGWLLVRSGRGGFTLVLLVAGGGLLLSLELVHARLPLIDNPRWNTSLKVAVQAWTLGAAGAGAASAALLTRHGRRLWDAVNRWHSSAGVTGTTGSSVSRDSGTDEVAPTTAAVMRSSLVVGLVVVVLLASAVFPGMVIATEIGSEIVENRYVPSIDGFNYVERAHEEEAAALRWLANRSGHSTLIEAPGNAYEWTSPAATFSGLPGVVGWDHEAEYRSPTAYERRVNRVDAMYTGNWSVAARNLRRYDVRYVYVGPNERDRYGSALRSFDRHTFSVAFKGGAVTIYEVNQTAL